MNKTIVVAVAAVAFAGSRAFAESGVAAVRGTAADSKIAGTVNFEDTKDGLKVTAKLSGLPAGEHGFHIHEFGSCDDAAKAAGSHYNPMNSKHGYLPKDGSKSAHGGDMGNLKASEDGAATVEVTLPGVSLSGGKHNAAGRAIVIHEKADDFGQPTGNAGNRIGCGAIVVTGK
ncbi:MAG: superoxide dismutase family protein [Elusimicrobia bacterium]|nr:superoxide dismutase family protein [Elusimicrobiota bacterium]